MKNNKLISKIILLSAVVFCFGCTNEGFKSRDVASNGALQVNGTSAEVGTNTEEMRFQLLSDTAVQSGMRVTRLNGLSVDQWITLSSGARAFVDAQGGLIFQPGGAFENMRPNEVLVETFHYQVEDSNGNSGIAVITITLIKDNVITPDPDPIPDPTPIPQPQPDPTPIPQPQPDPIPAPDPDPTPQPGGEHNDEETSLSGRQTYTIGTDRSGIFGKDDIGPIAHHGVRITCAVSHFSYDDPVVHPGDPGKAHLHMFWGNTSANAYTTKQTLESEGRFTCSGGAKNRSSYWTPALLNARGEAQVPQVIHTYYKSWVTDRSQIRPIPFGLEMLARSDIKGFYKESIGKFLNEFGSVGLDVSFPNCVKVDQNGKPVLKSEDNISHLAYADTHCPESHPYTIPTLSFQLYYDGVDYNERWQLASDSSPDTQGQSLHADYIAGWDKDTMDELTECVVNHRRDCGFSEDEAMMSGLESRPDGTRAYIWGFLLREETNRSPFGVTPKMKSGMMHHMSGH